MDRKHGNTLVRILRAEYGAGFAPSMPDRARLPDVLQRLDCLPQPVSAR